MWIVYLSSKHSRDNRIKELQRQQKEIADLIADRITHLPAEYLPEVNSGSTVDQIASFLDRQILLLEEIEQFRTEVEHLQKEAAVLRCKLDRSEHDIACKDDFINHRPAMRLRRQEIEGPQNQVESLRNEVVAKDKKVAELKSLLKTKVAYWRNQVDLHHDCGNERRHEAAIVTMEEELDISSELGSLHEARASQFSTRIAQLEPQVALLNNIKDLIHTMFTAPAEYDRFAVTCFVQALSENGVRLSEFGIDPARFASYLTWAQAKVKSESSPVVPVEGFRRAGTFFPLSGSFASASQVDESSSPLPQQGLGSLGTNWVCPRCLLPQASTTNNAATASTDAKPIPVLDGIEAPQSRGSLSDSNSTNLADTNASAGSGVPAGQSPSTPGFPTQPASAEDPPAPSSPSGPNFPSFAELLKEQRKQTSTKPVFQPPKFI